MYGVRGFVSFFVYTCTQIRWKYTRNGCSLSTHRSFSGVKQRSGGIWKYCIWRYTIDTIHILRYHAWIALIVLAIFTGHQNSIGHSAPNLNVESRRIVRVVWKAFCCDTELLLLEFDLHKSCHPLFTGIIDVITYQQCKCFHGREGCLQSPYEYNAISICVWHSVGLATRYIIWSNKPPPGKILYCALGCRNVVSSLYVRVWSNIIWSFSCRCGHKVRCLGHRCISNNVCNIWCSIE